jgi:pyrimidine operon attenuation protein/uracil phosphoribosyltransferase
MPKELMNKSDIDRTIARMAHEIIERNKGTEKLCLIGIQSGGAHLAHRISKKIKEIEGSEIPVGSLDIAFYRDDINIREEQPAVRKTEVPFEITEKKVVLIDDVLFTGRSIRAALDALIDIGRPSCILLAVLVDRGHRELPIKADFIGKNIPTAISENIVLSLEEEGTEDKVTIE